MIPLDELQDAAAEQLEAASDIPSIIRRARIKMNLSQKEVSIDLGYKSQASYARIERGEKLLSDDELIHLSKLLSIPTNKFIKKDQ